MVRRLCNMIETKLENNLIFYFQHWKEKYCISEAGMKCGCVENIIIFLYKTRWRQQSSWYEKSNVEFYCFCQSHDIRMNLIRHMLGDDDRMKNISNKKLLILITETEMNIASSILLIQICLLQTKYLKVCKKASKKFSLNFGAVDILKKYQITKWKILN